MTKPRQPRAKKKTKRLSVLVEDPIHEALMELVKVERRSITGQVQHILEQYIATHTNNTKE